MADLRRTYLFQLARVCGALPPQVDAMAIRDFANLTDSIDEHMEYEARLAGLRTA